MSQVIELTPSFLQANRAPIVSDHYNVVCPDKIREVMATQELELASLSTGKARKQEFSTFQRTLARYRGPELTEGCYLDLVYDSKHAGRGCDTVYLGIYRMLCTNGLFVGKNFFASDIRHNGETFETLQESITAALKMIPSLTETIKKMQSIELSSDQYRVLADMAATILVPERAKEIQHCLLTPNRTEDHAKDLWTVYNTIQENAMQGGIVYKLDSFDEATKELHTRNMTTRRIKANSVKDCIFNQELFDKTLALVA